MWRHVDYTCPACQLNFQRFYFKLNGKVESPEDTKTEDDFECQCPRCFHQGDSYLDFNPTREVVK